MPATHRHDAARREGVTHEFIVKHAIVTVVVLVRWASLSTSCRAGHDEDLAAGPHHLDLRAIEARQHGRRDHLVDRAERRLAAAEIEHTVDRAEQLVDLMGAEEDGRCRISRQSSRTSSTTILW